MASTTLVAYATKHDSTHQVAEQVAGVLRSEALDVDVRPADAVKDLEPYGAVVLGGALYMGRWHHDARRFLGHHREGLARRPLFIFGMGPLELVEEQVTRAREQLEAALAKVPEVRPAGVAIFGGVIDPGKMRFPFSHAEAKDARDADAIRSWAHEVASALRAKEPLSAPSAQ